jgi:hypothetical protein
MGNHILQSFQNCSSIGQVGFPSETGLASKSLSPYAPTRRHPIGFAGAAVAGSRPAAARSLDRPVGTLDHDAIKWNRTMISSLCLSMIFSENRFPLFRIMLYRAETA